MYKRVINIDEDDASAHYNLGEGDEGGRVRNVVRGGRSHADRQTNKKRECGRSNWSKLVASSVSETAPRHVCRLSRDARLGWQARR